MSKKKGKAPKKAVKKVATKKPAKKAAKKAVKRASSMRESVIAIAPSPRTKTVTIFVFESRGVTRIRTSPQRVYANPGDHVEFNVVNMIDDTHPEVTITFPGGGPWGKEPFAIRDWNRKPVDGNAPMGRFKYTIAAMGAIEDPEIELPEGGN
mgnify:FL=1